MEVLGTCDEVLKLVAAAVCKPAGTPTDLSNVPQPAVADSAEQPPAAKKTGKKEASKVLPGANVLTIATAE